MSVPREVVWSWPGPPALEVWRQEVEHDGRRWTQHGVTASAGAAGVVVLAQHEGRTLWLRHHRPVVGRTLWELPRGFGEPGADGTAHPLDDGRRELLEETGLQAVDWHVLGTVWADSGLLTNPVVAFRATALNPTPGPTDGEADEMRWLDEGEVRDLVRSGAIADGLSLATLALDRAHA